LKFEYLREFEPEFENVSGYELGAHMGSIHEKNEGPKISSYCTFKETVGSPLQYNTQVSGRMKRVVHACECKRLLYPQL
jgi:hypothetical protein